MKINLSFLLSRAVWTISGYGASATLRLGSNVVLSRLLSPEIFGIMVIVNSIKYGIELLTDVGIEQNIVQKKNGLESSFFNTAWTLQIIRGICLMALFLCLSPFLSSFYRIDLRIFLIISLAPFVNSLSSTSIFALVKNLEVRKRTLFELTTELITFIVCVTLAFITRTVWAPVIGAILSLAARASLSYFISHPAHRLTLERAHVVEILQFGKWIAISSFVIYAATNLDRMYLGKVAPFYILGIYGLARTIADLAPALANRLSYQIVFPILAATKTRGTRAIPAELAEARWGLVISASVLIGSATGWADWAIKFIFDPRYHQAGWMLFILMFGAWISVLSGLNEAIPLAFGKPAFNSLANVARLAFLGVSLPISYLYYGMIGSIVAVSGSEICRYFFIAVAQQKIHVSFWKQDGLATVVMIFIILSWVVLRQTIGLGAPWDGIFNAVGP